MAFSEVRKARVRGQSFLRAVIAKALGDYGMPSAESEAARVDLWAPVLSQDAAVGDDLRQRRRVPDIDPQTGEEREGEEGLEPEADEDHASGASTRKVGAGPSRRLCMAPGSAYPPRMTAPQVRDPHLAELWAKLEALPEHLKGEIIDGELHVQPRPRFRHGRAIGFITRHLGGAFDFDADGPGGWWILPEPGIALPDAPEISPDIAAWRRERMPNPPEDHPIHVVPDWVCEVLSKSNARYDRSKKLPFYARVGVPWAWLVDSRDRTIEVRELVQGAWVVRHVVGDEPSVRLSPFEEIELPLSRLWID